MPLDGRRGAEQADRVANVIGLGVRPVRRDPLALSAPRASAVAALAGLRQAVAALPAGLPAYSEYLAAAQRGRR